MNEHGTKSIAFTSELLEELEATAKRHTNGNLSELVRVLLKSSLEKLNSGELIIRKAQTTIIDVPPQKNEND
tara:strand:- start:1206 stop:1421 length:216 start_codon:yes stop_codon:yes gene_type:complete